MPMMPEYKIILAGSEKNSAFIVGWAAEDFEGMIKAYQKHLSAIYAADIVNWDNWKQFICSRINDVMWAVEALNNHGRYEDANLFLIAVSFANQEAEPHFREYISKRARSIRAELEAESEDTQPEDK